MITSEQAFDMLPYVVDIYDKLKIKEYATKRAQQAKKSGKAVEEIKLEVGEDVLKYIVKNSPKVKEEFFSVVGIAAGKTKDEAKKQPPTESIKVFMDVFQDKDLLAFFREAMQ